MLSTRRHVLATIGSLGAVSVAGCLVGSSDDISENEELALVVYQEGNYVYSLGKEALSNGFDSFEQDDTDEALDAFMQAVDRFREARSAFHEVNKILSEEDKPAEEVNTASERATTLHTISDDSVTAAESLLNNSENSRAEIEQLEDEFRPEERWEILTPDELQSMFEQR